MKQLTCEMCGSTDLMKQDGVFVCQSCGCKYSVEEAKKMMVEGTVDVTGSTVKVDNSSRLENLYVIARRAKNEGNSEEAAKYYDQIALEDPNSWEAHFYKVYFSCMQTKIANMGSACVKLSNSIESTFDLIKKQDSEANDKKKVFVEVYECCMNYAIMIANNIMSHAEGYSDPTNALNFVKEHVSGIVVLQTKIGDACKAEGLNSEAITAYKANQTYFGQIDASLRNSVIERIKSLDSSYTYETQTSSGCYVATAVYGSYDCPEVWTLRRFRDYTLAETWYGRAFIRTYYAISPTLVKWFGHTDWFKKMWRGKLDRMVANLQSRGVESTPYEDREW